MDLKLVPRINGTLLGPFGLALEPTGPTSREVEAAKKSVLVAGPIEGIEDIRFRSNDWMYVAPIQLMVGRPVFGYGPQSWHPLKAAVAELLEDIKAPYETSGLRQYYEMFAPRTIAEAHRIEDPGPLATIPATSLFEPWVLPAPPYDDPFAEGIPAQTPMTGPQTEEEGREEWRRIRRNLASIQERGYQPNLFEKGRINVTILRSRGEERYLVRHGMHRTAVLAAMGATEIAVGIYHRAPWVVDEDEAAQWPYVRSGLIPIDLGVRALRRYFTTPSSDPALDIAAECRAIGPNSGIRPPQ